MRQARILLHALFILVGVATVMTGPLLPTFAARWSLSDSTSGALFTAQFLLSVIGAVSAGGILRRISAWRLMCLGYLVWGIGALALASPVPVLGFLGACLIGLGIGVVNPAANLSAAALMPHNPGAALNLLNFFFSIGAVLAPFAVSAFLRADIPILFPPLVGLLALSGIALAWRVTLAEYHPPESSAAANLPTARRVPFALSAMLVLFTYVGVEVATGGWAPTYLIRAFGSEPALAATATSAFWGAILVTRLLAVAFIHRIGVLPLVSIGALLGLAGTLLTVLGSSAPLVFAGIALAGIGLGPVFASTVAYFLEHYGRGARSLTGIIFASGGTGGAVLPFLIGSLSESTGDLNLALWALPASAALILLLLLPLYRTRPDRA